jgi:hypothetical protein
MARRPLIEQPKRIFSELKVLDLASYIAEPAATIVDPKNWTIG